MDREIVAFLTNKDGDDPRHLMAWQMALALAPSPDDFDVVEVAYRMTDKFIKRAADEMSKDYTRESDQRRAAIELGVKAELERRGKLI